MGQTEEIMSKKLITISSNASLHEAYQMMRNNWVRHLPVTDTAGQMIGLISDRDVYRGVKAVSLALPSDTRRTMESWYFEPEHLVKDFMQAPLQMFDRATPLKKIVDRMIDEKASAFVISDHDEPIGIVTTDDCLRLLHHLLNDEEDQWTWDSWFLSPGFQKAVYSIGQTGL